jgi:hypothetical protein
MKEVDYAKLSEQYASFLVAVGGVSITVLTLVLGLSSPPTTLTEQNARTFLVAALIAATVSCFIGAHMMAETAAFFTKKGQETLPDKITLGQRLFVLATSNIFIAITLVLFSIVLLPTATGKVELAARLKPISHVVFLGVVIGALWWMALAAIDRMGVGEKGCYALAVAFVAGLVTGILYYTSKELRPQVTFIFIVGFAAVSVFYFAIIFKAGKACTINTGIIEMAVFSSAITISYASLVVAYFKIL